VDLTEKTVAHAKEMLFKNKIVKSKSN